MGEEYLAYNKRRWGSDGWTRSLRRMGAEAGAQFKNWKWWPSTLKAHCLVNFAKNKGISSATAKAALFEALYEEGANVSEEELLADLAASKLGLDRGEALSFLQSGAGEKEVFGEIQLGQARFGVKSVPHFILSGGASGQIYSISGAYPPQELLEIFTKLDEGTV